MSPQTKHTPGPWSYLEDQDQIVRTGTDHCIFELSYGGNDADYHLAAAAPELLEAAIEALETLERIGLMAHSDAAYSLRAAIAKAKGEAQ